MKFPLAAILMGALLALTVTACASSDRPKLCTDLDSGMAPILAIPTNSGGVTDGATMGRDAVKTIRANCPEHAGPWVDLFENPAVDPVADTPPEPAKFTMKVTGTSKRATINYGVSGSAGSADAAKVPWSKTMDGTHSFTDAPMVTAYTPFGSEGSLECTITDETGTVLASDKAESQGGDSGTASVHCYANG